MTFKWKVERAIPGRDKIVLAWKLPGAHIVYRKISVRISCSCQGDHRFRDIQPSALEPALLKNFYKPSFTPTANVQRMTTVLHEPECALKSSDSVCRFLHLLEPLRRHRIVVLSGFFWIHLSHRIKRCGPQGDNLRNLTPFFSASRASSA